VGQVVRSGLWPAADGRRAIARSGATGRMTVAWGWTGAQDHAPAAARRMATAGSRGA